MDVHALYSFTAEYDFWTNFEPTDPCIIHATHHPPRRPEVEAGYDDPDKSNLFFKLHQLQTGSWGASSIGRVTQVGLRRRIPG